MVADEPPLPPYADQPTDKPRTNGDVRIISENQRKRMYAIGKSKGWSDEDMRAVVSEYGFEHSKDVTRGAYDAICTQLEAGPQ